MGSTRMIGVAALLVACGSTSTGSDAGAGADVVSTGGVTVAGGVIYHSVNRLATEMSGTTPEYSMVDAEIHGQAALLASASAAPLGTVDLGSGCSPSGMCAFSVAGVELAGAAGGLVVGLRDRRATPVWVPSWTGTASAAEVTAAASSGISDARAFIVSREAFDVVLAPMTGVAPDELLARGVVFGLVYDEAGRPISGATVAVSGRTDLTIVYPNGMFTGTSPSTTMQGAFLAVPAAASASVSEVSFEVTAPSGSTLAWDVEQPALLAPGVLSFTLLYGH